METEIESGEISSGLFLPFSFVCFIPQRTICFLPVKRYRCHLATAALVVRFES